MIDLHCSRADVDLIFQIAHRAEPLYRKVGDKKLALVMDLTACHCNGCTLDLTGLLNAGEIDFSHDIYGIRRHINRETGKLEDCFTPRYARQ